MMNEIRRFTFSLSLILLSFLSVTGCVANHAYREKQPVLHEIAPGQDFKYSLAFVEFDDVGEMFTKASEIKASAGQQLDNTELGQTIAEIERINSAKEGPDPVFVLFIHGWKNNASDSSGNVWGFRDELQSLAKELAQDKPLGQPQRPVMGIYIGWRGAVTNLPVVKEFSFWNRKDAATRIPGAHLTEAVRRITIAAKSNPRAKCIVVGHSFGGLVMERTLTQAMIEMILENKEDNQKIDEEIRLGKIDEHTIQLERTEAEERLRRRIPDLTVLLNEAGPATESKEFLDFLTREEIEFSDGKKLHPLFLSLTSAGDSATHIIFPVGQFLGKHGLSTRQYPEPDEFGETDQNHYFLHTTANSSRLVSHVVRPDGATSSECRDNAYNRFNLGSTVYDICPSPGAKNKTPYWIMQIPTVFVPDHSSVFKPELRPLLEAFLTPMLGLPRTGEGVRALQETPAAEIKLRRKPRPELKDK